MQNAESRRELVGGTHAWERDQVWIPPSAVQFRATLTVRAATLDSATRANCVSCCVQPTLLCSSTQLSQQLHQVLKSWQVCFNFDAAISAAGSYGCLPNRMCLC